MRCPKCHYLSFEPAPRCRNCGYELSLSTADLAIKTEEPPVGPYPDLDLQRSAPVEKPPSTPSTPRPVTTELPLFVRASPQPDDASDEPLVPVPAAPRPPLAVRRTTPDPARLRAKYARAPEAGKKASSAPTPAPAARDLLDLDGGGEPPPADPEFARIQRSAAALPPDAWREPVGAVRRLEAAAIDVAFIGAINVALVWVTLKVCGLAPEEIGRLPWAPFLGFLFVLDVGYLLMFTASGGQTVGKVFAHTRVVGSAVDDILNNRVSPGQAAVRALLTLPSVLLLGLGFLPGLVGEGRAIHDRLSHTRVVRARA